MSPEVVIGVIAILVTLVLTIGGAIIAHAMRDERRYSDHESRISKIEGEIGTHETGIRGELHRQVNLIGRLRSVVYFIGRAMKLDVMKDLDDDK